MAGRQFPVNMISVWFMYQHILTNLQTISQEILLVLRLHGNYANGFHGLEPLREHIYCSISLIFYFPYEYNDIISEIISILNII